MFSFGKSVNTRTVRFFLVVFLVVTPLTAFSANLIVCNGPECQACHFVTLIKNTIDFLGYELGFSIVVIGFSIAGVMMVVGANIPRYSEYIARGKGILKIATIGFVFLLGGAFLVDSLYKVFVVNSSLGQIYGLKCVAPPTPSVPIPDVSLKPPDPNSLAVVYTDTNPAYGSSSLTPGPVDPASIRNAQGVNSALSAAIAAAGGNAAVPNSSDLINNYITGILAAESGGRANAPCESLADPWAAGCGIGQISPNTAKSLDPSLNGLGLYEIQQKLINDTNYNLALNAQLATLAETKAYNALTNAGLPVTEESLVGAMAAYYNGGAGAIAPSRDCGSGTLAYQCDINPGGYAATKNKYVPTVLNYYNAAKAKK